MRGRKLSSSLGFAPGMTFLMIRKLSPGQLMYWLRAWGKVFSMRPFSFDAESVELTEDEITEFADLVRSACHVDEQHKLARWLSNIERPQPASVQNYAQRQARFMWRTELRV